MGVYLGTIKCTDRSVFHDLILPSNTIIDVYREDEDETSSVYFNYNASHGYCGWTVEGKHEYRYGWYVTMSRIKDEQMHYVIIKNVNLPVELLRNVNGNADSITISKGKRFITVKY